LRRIYEICFGGADVPDYGRFGKLAKQIGGAGRLAEIMWQLSTKPPTGDVLAYILAVYGPKRKRGAKLSQSERIAEIEGWLAQELGEADG